jgi:methanogenic corrinoid protein MtbC1
MEDELHEVGLLFAHYLLRKAGNKVIYLGSNVPFSSVESAVKEIDPANILFFLVRKNDAENDLKKINKMKKMFLSQTIYMATDASRLESLKDSANFIRLFSVDDLEKQIIKNTCATS